MVGGGSTICLCRAISSASTGDSHRVEETSPGSPLREVNGSGSCSGQEQAASDKIKTRRRQDAQKASASRQRD